MGESALPAATAVVAILMLFASSPLSADGLNCRRHHLHQLSPAATTTTFFGPRPTPTRHLAVGGSGSGRASATFMRHLLPRDDCDAFTAGPKAFVVFVPPTRVRDDVAVGGDRRPRHGMQPRTRGTTITAAPTSVALSSSSSEDTPAGGGEGAGAQVAEAEAEAGDDETQSPSPSDMRVKEIQSELRSRGVSYADCFDRDSLVARLVEAREGGAKVDAKASTEESPASTSTSTTDVGEPSPTEDRRGGGDDAAGDAAASSKSKQDSSFDRNAVAAELRTLRVSELRKRLGERNIRWSNMIEKEDLVKALVDSMELSSKFSVSGELTPGEANDISESVLAEELGGEGSGVPLLLDVYATWCGPCQLMSPQIKAAAGELGTKVRVCKMDSDRFPEWSGRLEVGGLPTTILFDSDGKEVGRQEGALMKDQILEFVRPYL